MSPTASGRTAIVADDLQDRGFALDGSGWASVANAAHDGYVPVLVADERTENEAEPVLSEPFLLEGKGAGSRRFFSIEDGRVVGRYTGVGAMRTDGFRPVPLPLVPEHHVRDGGTLARATLVASVAAEDQTVTYRSPLSA